MKLFSLAVLVLVCALLSDFVVNASRSRAARRRARLRKFCRKRPNHPRCEALLPTSSPTMEDEPPVTPSGESQYDIDFYYVNGRPREAIARAFDKARAKWRKVIVGDLPVTLGTVSSACGVTLDPPKRNVDDLLIVVDLANIDGKDGTLGFAGPCSIENRGFRTVTGTMTFDLADVNSLVNQGRWEDVILHEMGHIIGIGTLWRTQWHNLVRVRSNRGRLVGADYIGRNGLRGNTMVQGPARNQVETDGGEGTSLGHWDEETYDNELMTGFLNANKKQVFSALTVLTLKDFGYQVDESAIESFTVPSASGRRLEDGTDGIRLKNDVDHREIDVFEVPVKAGMEQEAEEDKKRFEGTFDMTSVKVKKWEDENPQ